jgi:hypothetical protein
MYARRHPAKFGDLRGIPWGALGQSRAVMGANSRCRFVRKRIQDPGGVRLSGQFAHLLSACPPERQ